MNVIHRDHPGKAFGAAPTRFLRDVLIDATGTDYGDHGIMLVETDKPLVGETPIHLMDLLEFQTNCVPQGGAFDQPHTWAQIEAAMQLGNPERVLLEAVDSLDDGAKAVRSYPREQWAELSVRNIVMGHYYVVFGEPVADNMPARYLRMSRRQYGEDA